VKLLWAHCANEWSFAKGAPPFPWTTNPTPAFAELPSARLAQHRAEDLRVLVPYLSTTATRAVPELRVVAHGPIRKRIETLVRDPDITAGQMLFRWKFLHYYKRRPKENRFAILLTNKIYYTADREPLIPVRDGFREAVFG
jgi:hypothetical protein